MLSWVAFYDQVRALVLQQWPEVGTGGIWEAQQLERVDLSHDQLPLAVLQRRAARKGDWGLGRQEYEVELAIHYVGDPALTEDVLRDQKLMPLEQALLRTGIASGTVLEVTELDWSERQEINSILILKELVFSAASITATFLVGENA
jgi:hypothetical protein